MPDPTASPIGDDDIVPDPRSYGATWDATDYAHAKAALRQRRAEPAAPRVGDWVEFADGLTRIISSVRPGEPYEPTIQTSRGGSLYLGASGGLSFSGSLASAIPAESFTDTGRERPLSVWFSHHSCLTGADSGVYCTIPVRVWSSTASTPEADPAEYLPALQIPDAYVVTHSRLHLGCLTPAAHEETCGYWYAVTAGATALTAFRTREELCEWAQARGLMFAEQLPPEWGTAASIPISGVFRTASHRDVDRFLGTVPILEVPVMSNGEWTLGKVTNEAGTRVIHSLNPNNRKGVFPWPDRTYGPGGATPSRAEQLEYVTNYIAAREAGHARSGE